MESKLAMIDACALNNMGISVLTKGEYIAAIRIFQNTLTIVQTVLQTKSRSPRRHQTSSEEEELQFIAFREECLMTASRHVAQISTRQAFAVVAAAQQETKSRQTNNSHEEQGSGTIFSDISATTAVVSKSETEHVPFISSPEEEHIFDFMPEFAIVENDDTEILHKLVTASSTTESARQMNDVMEEEDSQSKVCLVLIRKTDFNSLLHDHDEEPTARKQQGSLFSKDSNGNGEQESGIILYNYGIAVSCWLRSHKSTTMAYMSAQYNMAYELFALSHAAFLSDPKDSACTDDGESFFLSNPWQELDAALFSILSLTGARRLLRQCSHLWFLNNQHQPPPGRAAEEVSLPANPNEIKEIIDPILVQLLRKVEHLTSYSLKPLLETNATIFHTAHMA